MVISITKCFLEWRLDNMFTIIVDNASSNDITVKEMSKQLSNWGTNIIGGEHLHVRCMALILNLIVQDGSKEIGKSIKRVRQAVKCIKQSPSRIRKFKECCQSQLLTCKKSLCLDVPTRWNSTYLMLDTEQHFELAFERYSFYDIGFLDHLLTYPCEDGTSTCILTIDDWEKVRSMVKFLETFYLFTLKVSSSKYVTNNAHFVEIAELDLILQEMMENGDDPHNKLDYVPFAIVDVFEKDIGDKLIESVKTYMEALFGYYVKKSSKGSLFPSSSPTSFGNSSSKSIVSDYRNFQKKGTMRTKQQFEKHKEVSGGSGSKLELDRYIADNIKSNSDGFDILLWWKVNEPRFLILAEMARDMLAIPISSVASECAFSTGGRILDPFRSSLTSKVVQSVICLQDWLRSEPIPTILRKICSILSNLNLIWLVVKMNLVLWICSYTYQLVTCDLQWLFG